MRKLYQQFYNNAPRDFIDLLHYCRQNKISIETLEISVNRLIGICTKEVTTEKLTALLGNKPSVDDKPILNSQTICLAQKQLREITALMN